MPGSIANGTALVATVPTVWSRDILREHKVAGFWRRFIGKPGSGMPIIQKSELLTQPGNKIKIGITQPLSGSGVSGSYLPGAALIGAEENLSSSAITVVPELIRHAVRWNRRDDKRNIIELQAEGRTRLVEWGMTKMDTERFAQFTSTDEADVEEATYAPNVYAVGHPGGDVDDVVAADLLTVYDIQAAKLQLVDQLAAPLMTKDGEPVYFGVITPTQGFNLKRDTEYQEYVKLARERAETNPLFTGALAMIDGVVLFDHLNVPVAENANAVPVDVGHGVMFGKEFAVEGVDETTHSEVETFDYGLEIGISYEFGFQPRRALELSSLQLLSANVAAAS